MHSCYRARVIALAAVLGFSLSASSAAQAECNGKDLFPALKSEAPAAYADIVAAASAMPFRHGKLFRLFQVGAQPSYIFATLHSSDQRITGFSPRLRAALAESKIVVLESIETGAVLRRLIAESPAAWRRAILAGENQRAAQLLSEADFEQLEDLLARKGLPKSLAQTLKPAALAFLLDRPDCESRGRGAPYVDELVAQLAHKNKIEIIGLESIIEQLDIADGLPHETERNLLISLLRQADHGEDAEETAIARYKEGDIGGLLAWIRSAEPIPGVTGAQIPPAFLDRVITLRTYRMRDRALPLLKRGGAFIAIGAAHLPGKEGLLRLLEENGYQVEVAE